MRAVFILGLVVVCNIAFAQGRGYRLEYAPADTSSLEIYWFDIKGHPSADSISVSVRDAATNASAARFRYKLGGDARPYSIAVAPGRYSVNLRTDAEFSRRPMNVDLRPRQLTRILIQDTLGALRFRYDGNATRPVSEFSFRANLRFSADTTGIAGSCAEEFSLIPGNYHVEIGTLPAFQLNTDIDSRAITQIDIPEPGFLQLTNHNALG